jgi:predicted dehydrogenase
MRVAVLGLGSIGSRHARNLLALGCEVIGHDPGAPLTGPEGVPRVDSVDAAFRDAHAVVVASPTSLHAEQVELALRAGLPTLVEKPLATTGADAERVAGLVAATGVTCGVAMNLRFHRGILGLRRLVEGGILGRIRMAQVSVGFDLRQWRPGTDYRTSYSARAALGGGIVMDAIHELDYLTWLLGEAESVMGETSRMSDLEVDVEDSAVAAVRLRSGALATVDLNYLDVSYRRRCVLVGSDATASWDWVRGTIEVARAQAEIEVIDVVCDVADTYVAEATQFVAFASGEEAPRTTAAEGLADVRLAEALLRSSETGRRVAL